MDLKAQIDALAARREALEAEMAVHSQRLESAGLGLHSSLVDAQGFPLADVDVASARADRHALFMLANDHKTQAAPPHAAPAPRAAPLANRAAPLTNGPPAARPYAVVDSVAPGSPAGMAGVRAGDQVVSFGGVAAAGGHELRQVAAAVQASKDRAMAMAVRREGRLEHLSVTPRRWSGPGLLGMHLRPLNPA
ncbi:hypothetical protein WJX81_003298 [Elliptochloris bilobata]|uniref:PDZ domain-containing protein n=1 Tax=Elliptochloris bilobata TaxID=381761 RepID=A0AAW1SIC5_9CHLO